MRYLQVHKMMLGLDELNFTNPRWAGHTKTVETTPQQILQGVKRKRVSV